MSETPPKQFSINDHIRFNYTNHRGETAVREAYVQSFSYGTTPYHDEPQWFMTGIDPKKGYRTFATKDMRHVEMIYQARKV